MLSILLALFLGLPGNQADAAWQQAERLAREGHSRQALERFQHIVAAHPEDVEARLWVARLLRRTGQTQSAEQEYRQALALAPQHVDAMVGLSSILYSRGEYAEATALLDAADRLSPQNPEVLAARGYGLRLAGHSNEAESYYQRATALRPDDPDIRHGFEQTGRINRHRVEGSFQHESLSGATSDAHVADVAIDMRASDRTRLHARVQAQQRFSREEARAGGGIAWRFTPTLTLRGSALFSPGANVIARSDVLGEVEQVRGRLELGAGIRHISFSTANVWILAPAATLWLNDRTAVTAVYYKSWTDFALRPAADNHSGLARLRYSLRPRLWIDAAYSRGYESIETLSVDELGSLRADTWSGGIQYHFAGLQSLATGVDYQRRSDSRTLVRITAGVVHRF
jgi:YaiO family outer membrane protein